MTITITQLVELKRKVNPFNIILSDEEFLLRINKHFNKDFKAFIFNNRTLTFEFFSILDKI